MRIFVTLAATSGLLLVSSSALAVTCTTRTNGAWDGFEDVPVDAHLWFNTCHQLTGYDAGPKLAQSAEEAHGRTLAVMLRTEGGERTLSGTLKKWPGNPVLFEVIPSAPLAERTSYELFVAERDERGVTPRRASTFRTGRRSATAFDDWTGPQERSETTKTLGRASSTQEWLRVSAVNGAIPLVELEIEQAEGVPEFLYVGPRGRIWNGVACACEGDFHRSESGAWEFAARPISARGERGPEWKGGWDTQQLYVVGPPKWVLVAVVAAVGVAVTALGRWLWRRGRKDQG